MASAVICNLTLTPALLLVLPLDRAVKCGDSHSKTCLILFLDRRIRCIMLSLIDAPVAREDPSHLLSYHLEQRNSSHCACAAQ